MFNKTFILKDTVVLPQFAKLCYLLNKLRTLRKKIRNICEIGKN